MNITSYKDIKSKDIKSQKLYLLWRKAFLFGEHMGCHQRPDRSFYMCGYQFPVCSRCTGVILGYVLALIGSIIIGFHFFASILGCVIMFIDWFLQAVKIKSSTNKRRFVTGVLGGYGIMSIQTFIIKALCKKMIAFIQILKL